MMDIAKWIVIMFGIFIISVGFLMLFTPEKARSILMKAGSTNVINYTEITLRIIPAGAMIIYADHSLLPTVFTLFGWFMLGTSIILYFVPRKMHHGYSLKCAELLKPLHVRLIAPFSFFFGFSLIYCVLF